jgi:hypothetical protein
MADTRRCVKATKQGKPCPNFPMYRHPSGDWYCHVHADRMKCQHADGRPKPGTTVKPKTLAMAVSPDQEALVRKAAESLMVQPWAILRACIVIGLREVGKTTDLERACTFPNRRPA